MTMRGSACFVVRPVLRSSPLQTALRLAQLAQKWRKGTRAPQAVAPRGVQAAERALNDEKREFRSWLA